MADVGSGQHRHCGDQAVFADDLECEGEPEVEFNPGVAARFPRKNAAAGVLARDEHGRVLFVCPTYKPFLEIPGGVVEDDESPLAACRREVREELGIDLPVGRLLLVDWMPSHGVWRDSLQFIFDGGLVSRAQINAIRLESEELSRLEFLELDAAKPQLRPSKARRVSLAYRALLDGETFYGEFGRRPRSDSSPGTSA
ncbi:NUDIX domain-containing protein [Amycolatopsis sp. WGS_07]|uniref:NUDIX domain-containing protein n=1 Tax=Amycolatopsis sp. WGS_07 TaxID=3076764 RepID=UPI00387377AD